VAVDSLFDDPIFVKFVDVENGSMAEVEDEGMPESFRPDVEGVFFG